jgi:hypothetical protein
MIWIWLLGIYFAIGFLLAVFAFSFQESVDALIKIMSEMGIGTSNFSVRLTIFLSCVITGVMWGPKLIQSLFNNDKKNNV